MLDVTLIRTHPDQVQAALRKRAAAPDIPAFLTLDTAFREARTTVEHLRAERRRISTEIAALRREGTPVGEGGVGAEAPGRAVAEPLAGERGAAVPPAPAAAPMGERPAAAVPAVEGHGVAASLPAGGHRAAAVPPAGEHEAAASPPAGEHRATAAPRADDQQAAAALQADEHTPAETPAGERGAPVPPTGERRAAVPPDGEHRATPAPPADDHRPPTPPPADNPRTPAAQLHATAKALADELAQAEGRLVELGARHQEFLDALPNLPDDDVVAGGKECNQVVRTVGVPPVLGFPGRDHVRLAQELGLVDHQRGTALGGRGYWVYRGDGAALEWALLNHFLDAHRRAGYEFVLPPHLLTYEAGYTAGQFPKFADEVFRTDDDHFLLPTAETALVNLHRGETLDERELPRRYVSYTPCYRKESGSHRTAERGTLRGHQFNKVELFQFARPQDSDAAHLELLARAEELVAGLGLHHRVTKLAAGDTSPAQAKTYDVEVWLPSLGAYTEVSSVSNARTYQARRGGIRYRPAGGGKAAYVHTLNASGLATSRLLPAILEQHQRADGTVLVPEVLRRWGLPELLRPA